MIQSPGLVRAFEDRDHARHQAARVILEHEGERQAHAGDDRHDVLEGRLDQDRHDHGERRDADAQPQERNQAQDRQPQVQRRPLGDAA